MFLDESHPVTTDLGNLSFRFDDFEKSDLCRHSQPVPHVYCTNIFLEGCGEGLY